MLTAARSCFGSRGYSATTNRELAAAAGLTAAALYRYFPSKLALFLATVDGAMAELEPVLRAATVDCDSGRAELVALVEAAGSLHAARPDLAAFLSSLPVEMQRNPEIADAMSAEPDPVSRLMADAVERAHAGGELSPHIDPGDVIAMVVACNIGLSLWASAIMPQGSADAIRTYAHLLAGQLFVAAPRSETE